MFRFFKKLFKKNPLQKVDNTVNKPSGPAEILPRELMLLIFSYVGIEDLATLKLVSTYWNTLTKDDNLWCYFAKTYQTENHLTTKDRSKKYQSETNKDYYRRLRSDIQLFGTVSNSGVMISVKPDATIRTVRKAFAEKIQVSDSEYLDLKKSTEPKMKLYDDMTLTQAGIGAEDTLHIFCSYPYKRR